MSDDLQVRDNPEEHQLELEIHGELARLVYRRSDDRLVLVHTEVPDSLGGRGLGGRLVRAGVDLAAADGLAVEPRCPFARSWLERHPDEAARVAIEWPAA